MSVRVPKSQLSGHFVPYYYQIANLLRRKIEDGEILPGAKLPGEFELAESFGVSRVPVRQALSLLVGDGILIRHRGRGTFVTQNPPIQSYSKLSGAIGDFVATGLKGKLELLGMEHVHAPNSSADFSGFPRVKRSPGYDASGRWTRSLSPMSSIIF
jgi:GntR family transcriptional regulator